MSRDYHPPGYWKSYYWRTVDRRRELARKNAERRRRARGVLPLSPKERAVRLNCKRLGIPYEAQL